MADYQALTEHIRSFVASTDQTKTDELAGWAQEYARLCREANERLRRCADYLRRGLRAEAIHLADAEPNLLDMFAALDLPELAQWKELCTNYSLHEPPRLLVDEATALNEAYAEAQPVQSLMAYHRLLALARAPLKRRLAVMRRLAEADPATAFWDEDVRAYEQARLEEIRTQVRQMANGPDAAVLAQLQEELDTGHWRVTVPETLRKVVGDAAERRRKAGVESELRTLLPALNNAYGAMAFDECRALVARWEELSSSPGVQMPANLQEQVEPILQWFAGEKQKREQQVAFETACNALQQALDVDAPNLQLELAYRTALKYSGDMPEALELRYRQRIAMRAAAIRHKRLMIYSAIAAVFILGAGITIVIAYRSIRASEIRDAATALETARNDIEGGAVDKGKLIRKQVVEQHARILENPNITTALANLDAAVAKEQSRAADFQKHFGAAKNGGVEHPDDGELALAAALVKTSEEQELLADWKSQLADYRAQEQQRLDAQLNADARALTEEINDKLTPKELAADPDAYAAKVTEFEKRARELEARPNVSEGLKTAQVSSINGLILQKREEFRRAQGEQGLLKRVGDSGASLSLHAEALKDFVAAYPDSPRTGDFRKAMDLAPGEGAINAWSGILRGWSGELAPHSFKTAQDRAAQVEKYLQDYPSSPMQAAAAAYSSYLKQGLEAASPDGPWKKTFHSLLTNPLVHDVKILTTTDGKCYYVEAKAAVQVMHKPGDNMVEAQSFVAFLSAGMTPQPVRVEPPGLLNDTTPAPSPQGEFAEAGLSTLNQFQFDGWEFIGLDLTDALAESKINPVLKGILLCSALRLDAQTLSWTDNDPFASVAGTLDDMNLTDIGWLDPTSPPSHDVVEKLKLAMTRLPVFNRLKADLDRRRAGIMNAVRIDLEPGGVLMREGSAWRIAGTAKAQEGARACVVDPKRGVLEIAHAADGKWKIDGDSVQQLPEGTLVFIGPAGK